MLANTGPGLNSGLFFYFTHARILIFLVGKIRLKNDSNSKLNNLMYNIVEILVIIKILVKVIE